MKKKNIHEKFYRPKINKNNYYTIGRYSPFMKQSLDLNDWGFQKRHQYDWTEMNDYMIELNTNNSTKHQLKSSIKYHYTYTKGKPFGTGKNRKIINSIDDIEEIYKHSKDYSYYSDQWATDGKITMHKERWLCMERHILAAKNGIKEHYLFYTTSPNKEYNIICLDVDDIDSDEAYYDVIRYLLSLFPNCYYERSTNGTGLHFYIIIYFDVDRMFFSEVNQGVYRNVLYYLLSDALRSFINDHFSVKFDEVKGTNPLYDVNNNFLKYGTLVKLPAPVTYEQFKQLYYSSIYSEDYLLYIINYLDDLSCRYIYGLYSIASILSSLFSLLKTFPIRSNPKDFIPELKKENQIVPTTTFLPSTTINNGGSFTVQGEKVVKNRKYTIHDIMNEGDSRVRETLYIKKYVGEYYSKYNEIPDEEEVEKEYRIEMNYHKIGDFRKKRFSKYYKHTVDTFDKDKASDGSAPYKIGMYDAVIQRTDEELTEWVNENTAYKYKIYKYDVDIALEYISICSKNKKNRAREILIKRYSKQEGITEAQAEEQLKNTVPREGLIGFCKYISENHTIDGKKINKCNGKKATALFAMVVELGLAECFDKTSDRGRARKYGLSEAVRQIRESWNTNTTIPEETVDVAEVNSKAGMAMVV